MSTDPLVYVLVSNWNGREHLQECFETLLASDYDPGRLRVVMVDDASTDDSVAYVRERFGADPRVSVIECPENMGWSPGNNLGMTAALEAGADYVFLLNNDTAIAPEAIGKLVAFAERHPGAGSLAPKMLLYDKPAIINSVGLECSLIGSCWDLGLGRLDAPKWNVPRQVIGACGGAWFIRAEALRKCGLLPGEFFIYLDDLDLCLRMWNAGYEIWSCPEAVVRHKFSATTGQGAWARRKYYLNTRNRSWLVMRSFPLSKTLRIKLAYIRGEMKAMGRAARDGEYWKLGMHLKAWAAFLGYLPRAFAERLRQRRQGMGKCRFWHFIRTDRLFFRGTELPDDGWYGERDVCGTRVRPMSAEAHIEGVSGNVRLISVNPCSALGPARIDVLSGDTLLCSFETRDREERDVDVGSGPLRFVSRHIFDADDTDELIDIGGWIRWEPASGEINR